MPNIALISLYGVENNGVRTISSLLQENGFNPYIIFFKRWINNDIHLPTEKEKHILISLLKELNIEIVGISFTSPFLKISKEITQLIKNALAIKVVWGGIHATVDPEGSLNYCDIVCRGEGEYAMLDVAKAHTNKYHLAGIKNICFRDGNKLFFEEMRPLIQDLNSLPNQDYGGSNKFFIEGKLVNKDPLLYSRELRIFASRGCPFNCSYCYNGIFRKLYRGQNYYRIRKVDNVIAEIKSALNKIRKIRKIKFDDDSFTFPRSWIDEFCIKYKKQIGLPFEILFNPECLEKELLERLKNAGLRRLQVGIQTGSRRESNEIYNRSLPLEKIKQVAFVSRRLKLDIVYDIILDNPMGSFEDKQALIDFLLTLPRPFSLFLYSLTIFPGTRICELFLEKGLIGPRDIEGEANKSFYQFRFSFSYPRKNEELFAACIISLISKSFIPKSLISNLKRSSFLKRHPLPLKWFVEICNSVKLLHILIKMFIHGDLSIWKIEEYGLPRRFLIQ